MRPSIKAGVLDCVSRMFLRASHSLVSSRRQRHFLEVACDSHLLENPSFVAGCTLFPCARLLFLLSQALPLVCTPFSLHAVRFWELHHALISVDLNCTGESARSPLRALRKKAGEQCLNAKSDVKRDFMCRDFMCCDFKLLLLLLICLPTCLPG